MDNKSQEWESYVLSMAYHKNLEKLEELNKEDTENLSCSDWQTYHHCAKSLYYLKQIKNI